MRDIKEILKAWANSRIEKRIGTEYPSHASGMIAAPRSFDYRQYLTEDEARVIDKAVLLLRADNELQYTVLTKFYLSHISCSKQAKITGKQTCEMTKLLSNAEAFIRGNIIEFFKNTLQF